MPLNWTVAEVRNNQTMCWDTDRFGRTRLHPVTEAVIFHTITVGMNKITDENVDEFVHRVTQTEELLGPSLRRAVPGTSQFEPRPLTAKEIRSHIGLQTNAKSLTRDQWRRDVVQRAARLDDLSRLTA